MTFREMVSSIEDVIEEARNGRIFVRVDDELPKLSSMKVDKKALRRDAWRSAGVVWRPAKGEALRPLTDEDRDALAPLLDGPSRAT